MKHLLLTTALICTATLPRADDAALIVGVPDYQNLRGLRGVGDVVDAGRTLRDRGFVLHGTAVTPDLQGEANRFAESAADADRLLAVMAGRFVTDGTRSWLIPGDATRPAPFSVGNGALSVETALATLAATPGQAILVLGHDARDDADLGSGLRYGLGALDIPSGVTVIEGPVADTAALLEDVIARPGGDVIAGLRADDDLSGAGFLPTRLILVPAEGSAAAAPPPAPVAAPAPAPAPAPVVIADPAAAENAAWNIARAADTEAGYVRYLDQFPRGAQAATATTRLRELRDPNRPFRTAEESLNLSTEARRAVQRNLTILGYDTNGVDGIWGAGTRNAIRRWQGDRDVTQSGYLRADQIDLISREAAGRTADRDRADRDYWANTGATGTQAGFRAYLDRYPQGAYATQARDALAGLAPAQNDRPQETDAELFERASRNNSVSAYRTYLERQPQGRYRDEAQERIRTLERAAERDEGTNAAQAAEQALALDPIALRLVEARLQQLGLNPGATDGRLDGDSRRAIQRYQQDRQLSSTGYLDQATIGRLLTDAFR